MEGSDNSLMRYDTAHLRAVPITRAVERLGRPLVRRGCRSATICPWHDDHHPSLVIYKNRCHCFACGQGGDVIAYVMRAAGLDFRDACRWLGGEAAVTMERHTLPAFQEQPVTYLPPEAVERHLSAEGSLCQCLSQLFDPALVEWLAEEYRLGCYELRGHPTATLLPNIDAKGRIHDVKVQDYCTDLSSPGFFHCDRSVIYWLGSMMKRDGLLPAGARLDSCGCLFGAHLLPAHPASTVALVESPKNALVGAAAYPRFLWLATGSKGLLTRRTVEDLRGRNVVVYPDADACDDWTAQLATLADVANFTLSRFCQQNAPPGDEKFDIADYIIAHRMSRRKS